MDDGDFLANGLVEGYLNDVQICEQQFLAVRQRLVKLLELESHVDSYLKKLLFDIKSMAK